MPVNISEDLLVGGLLAMATVIVAMTIAFFGIADGKISNFVGVTSVAVIALMSFMAVGIYGIMVKWRNGKDDD